MLVVRNTSARTLPDVTVAVTSFDYLSDYPNLAVRRRPVWVVDQGPGRVPNPPVETVQVDPPGSGTTADYNVWALGPLRAGRDAQLRVARVPRQAGAAHASSTGCTPASTARPRRSSPTAAAPAGSFTVDVADKPAADPRGPADGQGRAGPYVPSEA